MTLRPRHFVLLAIVIGLFVYNIIRHRENEKNLRSLSTTPAPVVITTPRLNTPAWAAFDHAAALRDDPSTTFDPALKDLNQLLPLDPNQNDGHLTDIKGCLTWLEFYREGMAQTHPDPQMKSRATHHVDDCVKYHLDTGA
jgi:hypothetical protein